MTTKTKKHQSEIPVSNSNTSNSRDIFNVIHKKHEQKGLTQKKAFEILIPHLFVLRKKGCSWEQITKLLNDKCGFKLQATTVRTYFSEMARRHLGICQEAMTEHILAGAKTNNLLR
ncbi:hypothetical protein RGU70_13390 [Herbaspirillum sp. RTI4]|uniref:hypothetical protein n=1 Tax=Herbaspirillum sp. RTI4 TaxID=3048640 RepID=UPI002AB376A1|nr:hypothetical protein [Herbaspirillum sp. RTI4]MDY7579310.1 hypothetical protein [Herbaspirillum sp. RTI4]MEA9980224.1 hypothetical protein [Herbaspirillum sp. RTI4]